LRERLSRPRVRVDRFQVTQGVFNILPIRLRDGKPLVLPNEEEEKALLEFHQGGFAGGGLDNIRDLLDFIRIVVVAAVARPVGLVAGSGKEEEIA
jgi:hypothetical protein